MASLSEEQRRRIEENRHKALLKRSEKNKTESAGSTAINSLSDCRHSKGQSIGSVQDHTFHTNQIGAKTQFQQSQFRSVTNTGTVAKNSASGSRKPSVTGVCHLISIDRFLVDVAYDQELIAKFQKIPDRRYHPNERHWSFPVSYHEQLMDALKQLRPGTVVAPLPPHVLRCLRRPAPVADNVDLSSLDAALLEALMPFQREGVQMGVARNGRVLLADDMGLGKTIQAIGIVSYFHDWPLLVVCPSSMRYQWKQEFLRFLPSQHPSTVVVMDSSKGFAADARVLIVSYDLLSRCADQLGSVRFLSIIMDESHCLKNPKAARTQAAMSLLRAARRVLLLSGTPALSRPVELYTQIRAIDKGFMPVFNEFGVRYCGGQRNTWGWDFSGASHMTELQLLLERHVMIRRLKRDVIKQLPSKRRHLVLLDPSQVRCRTKKMSTMENRMNEHSLKGVERRGALLEYFRETAVAKLPAVCSYLEDLLDSCAKFICFAHHRVVMDAVCDLLERRREQYIRIDGGTTASQRKRECDRFQDVAAVRAAVLSITAANAGLTLTAASLVVFAELFWNPGVLTQAEDRAHRIGQQDSVQVRYLVARGTADDHIWPLVQRKLDVLNSAGLTKDDFTEADQDRQESSGGRQRSITELFRQLEDEESSAPEVKLGQMTATAATTSGASWSTERKGRRAASEFGTDTVQASQQKPEESSEDANLSAPPPDEWRHEMDGVDLDAWTENSSWDISDHDEPPPAKKARGLGSPQGDVSL